MIYSPVNIFIDNIVLLKHDVHYDQTFNIPPRLDYQLPC